MKRVFKKVVLLLLFLIGVSFFFLRKETSSEDSPGSTQLEVDLSGGSISFFDRSNQKLYLYSILDGRLRRIWKLEKLGEDLKRAKE